MKKKNKIIESAYKPRPTQQVVHSAKERFVTVVAHRGFGKTWLCLNEIVYKALMSTEEQPVYMFLSPTKEQSKRNVWITLKNMCKKFPDFSSTEADLTITFTTVHGKTAQLFLAGAEKPEQLRGAHLSGLVVDETANLKESVWTSVLFPALNVKRGWAKFIGTPHGKNNIFYEFKLKGEQGEEGWATYTFTLDNSGVFNEKQQKEIKKTLERHKEEYEREYLCSFEGSKEGSYFGSILDIIRGNKQIGSVKYNPSYPVVAAWDIGLNYLTCIWFAQYIDNKVCVIDYFEGRRPRFPSLIDIAKHISNKPYVYDYHVMPHDMNQTEQMNGRTKISQMKKHLNNIRVLPHSMASKEEGIAAAQALLYDCWFDEEKCRDGLKALEFYHSKYVEKDGFMATVPAKDWSNDAADAFRYLSLGLKKIPMNSIEKAKDIRRYGKKSYFSGDFF